MSTNDPTMESSKDYTFEERHVYSMSKVVNKIRNKVKATRNEILHKQYHINTQ